MSECIVSLGCLRRDSKRTVQHYILFAIAFAITSAITFVIAITWHGQRGGGCLRRGSTRTVQYCIACVITSAITLTHYITWYGMASPGGRPHEDRFRSHHVPNFNGIVIHYIRPYISHYIT